MTEIKAQLIDPSKPHWPRQPVHDQWMCYCGYRAEPRAMLSHVETWNYAVGNGPFWGRSVPLMSVRLNQYPVPGHDMLRLQSSMRPGRFRVKCSCGWMQAKWGWGRGVKEGRLHLEEMCCTILGLDVEAVRQERRGGGFPDATE